MKQKNKKNITHWLSVIVIGVALGLALQFVRAWTEPTVAPPGGNVGAPINTSDNAQAKGATAGVANTPRADKPGSVVANDFCLPDGTTCLSTVGGPAGSDDEGYCEEGQLFVGAYYTSWCRTGPGTFNFYMMPTFSNPVTTNAVYPGACYTTSAGDDWWTSGYCYCASGTLTEISTTIDWSVTGGLLQLVKYTCHFE